MRKLYCVGWGRSYANWFRDVELTGDFETPKFQIEDADIVLFTGGEDVSPYLYGKTPHPTSYWTTSRDEMEVEAFKRIRPDALAYGTCRGLQLLNVMNGGILCQDATDHWCSGTHEIHNDTESYRITSLHHQMVYPSISTLTIMTFCFGVLHAVNITKGTGSIRHSTTSLVSLRLCFITSQDCPSVLECKDILR